jgi:hypothetical protein
MGLGYASTRRGDPLRWRSCGRSLDELQGRSDGCLAWIEVDDPTINTRSVRRRGDRSIREQAGHSEQVLRGGPAGLC